MVPEIDAWDIELLLAVKGLPWDRRRADPAARIKSSLGSRGAARARRVYFRRAVEIRKYGVTVGCLGCMSITAGTTVEGLSDECRARIDQKMLEDITGEGAMRPEEAIRRKRTRPDDENGRADVAMEVAAWNPIRPFQHGGSSSSWEVRPEPSRRRDAQEELGGDVVRARMQDPQRVVRTAEEARLQPREELEAAVDSIYKHVKELGALHVPESDVGEIFLPGRSAKLGTAFSELPGAVVQLRYGWDLASAAGRQECWKTLHAERPELVIGSPPSRRQSPWIKDEREARLQGIKHSNFCCAVYRWQTERGVHFLHEHPWRASSWDLDCLKAVRGLPGVAVVRCDQRLYGSVEHWPLKDGGWGERQSTQRTGWMTSMNDLARELSEMQGLDQSHELETRVPSRLIMHATERYPPRLIEAILRCLSIHLRRKKWCSS